MNIEAATAGWRSSLSKGAGWRSSLSSGAGWISPLSNGAHCIKPNIRRRRPGAENFFYQPGHQSQRKIIQFALSISAGGPSGTHWPGKCLMKCSSQDERILLRANCHFIRAVCSPAVSLCGSCRMVLGIRSHLHTVISSFRKRALGTEHACEPLRHRWPQTGLLLIALHIVLLCVVYFQLSKLN